MAYYTTDEISALVDDYTAMPSVSSDLVVHTETRLGEPVAICNTWQFGGHWDQWDATNPLIAVDGTTWDGLSDTGRDYLVAHERHERNAAREDSAIAGDGLSPSEIVDRYHNEANRRAVAELSEESATIYARDIYELTIANSDDNYPGWQATYILRGIEELVPEDLPADRSASFY